MDKRNLLKNSMILRSAASVTAIVLIAAASLIPAKAEPAQLTDPNLLNPAPIVMTIEEPAEAVIEEETEEEVKKQKLGFFASLKLAFYAFCAGAGAWLASRIPWGKIFNKRNAVIVLLLAAIMLAYRFGLPAVMEAMAIN
jgi:hypothetical protein